MPGEKDVAAVTWSASRRQIVAEASATDSRFERRAETGAEWEIMEQ